MLTRKCSLIAVLGLIVGLLPLLGVTAAHASDVSTASPSTASTSVTHHDPRGLAATPPMGWNDWYTFYCNVNEDLVKQTADAMVASGMRDAGYKYVNLDDCWAGKRDANGNMTADPNKFPHGIKALADYVHARGLKLGVYTDVGTKTCAGYEAGYGNEQRDVNTFARWGVDFVKVDWCNVPYQDFPGMSKQEVAKTLYTRWSKAFDAAPRDMLFSICVWEEAVQSWQFAPELAQMWRTSGDYSDSWDAIMRNGDQVARLHNLAGPGGWNDPDILMVGHGQLNNTEYRSHFSIWSMAAAPLLAGNDLRSMSPETKDILTNREVIAIDQDPLGVAGRKVRATDNVDVWVRPLANGDTAALLVNRTAQARLVSTDAAELGLGKASRYSVRDLWAHTTSQSAGTFSGYLPPHGSRMIRISTDKGSPTDPDVSWGTTASDNISGLDAGLAAPGQPLSVDGIARNDGSASIEDATASITAPDRWTVTPAISQQLPVIKRAGGEASAHWEVTPPQDATPGTYTLRTDLRFSVDGVHHVRSYVEQVRVPAAPPSGQVTLSHLDWLKATSGWRTAQVDHEVGGGPLRLNGTTYATGIGVASPSDVEYYLGGKCSRFQATVGIDDVTDNVSSDGGTAVFQVLTDGQKRLDTDVVARPEVKHVDVDVTGAQTLTLHVGDAGDGGYNDRADWADATISCS